MPPSCRTPTRPRFRAPRPARPRTRGGRPRRRSRPRCRTARTGRRPRGGAWCSWHHGTDALGDSLDLERPGGELGLAGLAQPFFLLGAELPRVGRGGADAFGDGHPPLLELLVAHRRCDPERLDLEKSPLCGRASPSAFRAGNRGAARPDPGRDDALHARTAAWGSRPGAPSRTRRRHPRSGSPSPSRRCPVGPSFRNGSASCASAASNVRSSNGSASPTPRCTDTPGSRSRVAVTNGSEGSSAETDSGPSRRASSAVRAPVPQPTSRACPPAAIPAASTT